jgi:hypothetical protein
VKIVTKGQNNRQHEAAPYRSPLVYLSQYLGRLKLSLTVRREPCQAGREAIEERITLYKNREFSNFFFVDPEIFALRTFIDNYVGIGGVIELLHAHATVRTRPHGFAQVSKGYYRAMQLRRIVRNVLVLSKNTVDVGLQITGVKSDSSALRA